MIRVLDKNVANKIAAGEVVDRPLSVIKELVENSIDAGATSIICEIKKGGKTYIRITDNGSGIPREEIKTAFLRHGTSKIINAEDLDTIGTLGFRGEALASIAAVSRVEIVTRTEDEKIGTREVLVDAVAENVESTGCEVGTTIIVEDLFYNTPARLKFLKSEGTESSVIIEFMMQIALAYPNIRIRMVNNENMLFATRGQGDRLHTIATLTTTQFSNKLIPVEEAISTGLGETMNLSGYVSSSDETRASRKNQVFFVNGRVVNSKILEKAVENAYKERVFPGRFPSTYLFLTLPASSLDVNIHPTKREIRFHQEAEVIKFVEEAIKKAISLKTAIPKLSEDHNTNRLYNKNKIFHTKNKAEAEVPTSSLLSQDGEIKEEQVDIKKILSTFRSETQRVAEELSEFKAEISRSEMDRASVDFQSLEFLGIIFATYILLADDDTFYIVDQHAAHERINFEKLINEYKEQAAVTQSIIAPFTFDTPLPKENWIETIERFGFDVEEFGPMTFKVRGIPIGFSLEFGEKFISDFFDTVSETTDFDSPDIIDKIASRACKSSVRGGDHLKEEEVYTLLKQLSLCKAPYSCPHGRPTLISMGQNEIQKKFMRT